MYEPGSYVPLARLDANGEQTEQGGLGTTDDAELETAEAERTAKTIAASQGASSAGGLKGSQSQPAANDAEAQYWAALETTAQQRAKATGTYGSESSQNPKLCDVYYFHTDQVGMPEELTNAQGQLVWQARYKTWGSTIAEEWEVKTLTGNAVHRLNEGDSPKGADEQQQNLRFQGQYLDRETGLHYNTFRYYDADIGRFISPDPIGLEGGINLGSYSPNPIGWIDPWGWCAKKLGKNMEAANVARPANATPHHIAGDTSAASLPGRDILAKHGIDADDAVNGVFLPNRNNVDPSVPGILHNGRHPDTYINAVNKRLATADARGGKQAVLQELGAIRQTLSNALRDAKWSDIL